MKVWKSVMSMEKGFFYEEGAEGMKSLLVQYCEKYKEEATHEILWKNI